MKSKLKLFGALLMLNATLAFGQTAAEVEAKYGKPTKAYSVSQFIWMTPEYADDGQVCRMRLYPKRVSGDINYVVKDLPFDDFKSVVDQLIPLELRGAKKDPFDGSWTTGGGSMWATFNYERVSITYSAGFRVTFDPKSLKKGETVFLLPEGLPDNQMEPQDEFFLFRQSRVEIVTIRWRDRKCSN